jgi:hypothetical protein
METTNYWIYAEDGYRPVNLPYHNDSESNKLIYGDIYEAKLVQREDRIDTHEHEKIDILNLLKGKSKERWMREFKK